MTAILGISAFYHDAAAALVVDGKIVAAAQEERFTRKKHDAGFPENAIGYCLQEAGLKPRDLDYVIFYEKPMLKFERLLETYLSYAPFGFCSFLKAMPLWFHRKLHLPQVMRKGLNNEYTKRFLFTEHHESHAASAFFPSPFEEAAIITLDGVGEWATASYGKGRGNEITLTHELNFPHSLGLLYSAFTYFCGFRVNSGEYKLMGLAPYGNPIYADLILEKLIDFRENGSFRMDMTYFNYCHGLTMTSKKFEDVFGGPPRKPEAPLTEREMNLAASVQKVTEEVILRICCHVHEQTGLKKLCMAGGVALNCVANGRVLRETPFEDIWIQPAAGDAGGALGAALIVWYQLLGNTRESFQPDGQEASFLGPRFSNDSIKKFLDTKDTRYRRFDDEQALCEHVADLIALKKVVGWFQGRMEFGPRALGCRSILGDARYCEMQSVINRKIKFRESFRPFAPAVLQERVEEFFEVRPAEDSPYMLLVASVSEVKRRNDGTPSARGLDKVKQVRSVVPAITHVDNSARIQTVDAHRHGRFYKLLKAFESRTDCPLVINTSFNVRGEPIVCTPENAYECFMATNMDVLVLENFVLMKEEQPDTHDREKNEYLSRFEYD